jgi:hypothetical protein
VQNILYLKLLYCVGEQTDNYIVTYLFTLQTKQSNYRIVYFHVFLFINMNHFSDIFFIFSLEKTYKIILGF